MAITVEIPDDLEQRVRVWAAERGQDVGAAIVAAVEEGLRREDRRALEKHFRELAATWKRERGPHSSAARLADHPAYRAIMALGPAVVPLILGELAREPDHWFRALHELTGANPVPEAARGRLNEMALAWLVWGRQQGYTW